MRDEELNHFNTEEVNTDGNDDEDDDEDNAIDSNSRNT